MTSFGSNTGYVDELYARYLKDPQAVSEAWREFFADYRPGPASAAAPPPPHPAAHPEPPPPRGRAAAGGGAAAGGRAAPAAGGAGEPIRGIAARIVENMTASLAIPTATSARAIPVKLLEENRRLINGHQTATYGPKISFTHIIAYAVARALKKHPAMNSLFVELEDTPHRLPRPHINLGIAIDLERHGERLLLVPNIRHAGELDFPSFVGAYDDLVARARAQKLTVEDFKDTTVTLTNPGTIGTALSVPRLMQGQSAIIGIGAIDYPAEYKGMDREVISQLGLSKVMTATSTYDHRVIQGAESGAFLATLERLLLGQERFYERIFKELGVPHEPVRWTADVSPSLFSGAAQTEAIEKQAKVIQLIRSYRVRGHLWADLDPLGYEPEPHPELELSHYGLSVWDLDRKFSALGLAGNHGVVPLREIIDILRETYCRHFGVEYMHIPERELRAWLQERMERTRNAEPLPRAMQLRILSKLNAAEAFERFLHTAYVGHKRFSLEGAEALIPMLDALLNAASMLDVQEAVIGMAHRGRLNVLANVVGKSLGSIFREFEDMDPSSMQGSGDVKYHLGASGTHTASDGSTVGLTVASNPSHLEAVDPVVEGMVRARQDRAGDESHERILPILIHGDAAFAGQGVVAETLNLSQLKGYQTGGTVHIVVNNQIGFTTGPEDARSSLYATDVAKMVRAPIFHVNGDYPEAGVRAVRLAIAFRHAFKRDVVVDLVCYRRWGHNETDDPSYTHPLLYARIEKHRSVRKLYTEQLLRRGDLDPETAERSLEDFRHRLERAFEEVRQAREAPPAEQEAPEEPEVPAAPAAAEPAGAPVATAASPETLEEVLEGLERTPEGFETHPKLARQLAQRRERVQAGRLDWALAEALAFGSLVLGGVPVRLSGQDSGRGTFSQRHATLYHYRTGAPYVPLASLRPGQAPFMVYDSLLSELAVVGFEYGYSVDYPQALVLWEAQFGDFVNGAQVIIDQFVSSAEDKWRQKSGLVLLLPHGYEGQGPEHSSARFERFLQLGARGNLHVTYPTTPAQYFHLLRRQALRQERKPLVVLTPKSLLRHPEAVSPLEALTQGAFQPVIDDPRRPAPEAVRRLVLTTGKLCYELEAHRRDAGVEEVALVRLEEIHPFPAAEVAALLGRYGRAREVVWAQEEPKNMGAWSFVDDLLRESLGPERTLLYVGRPASPSPATGSHARHQVEQQALVEEALRVGEAPRPAPARREVAARH